MKKIYSLLAVVGFAIVANAQIVINEIYGAGGNTGALVTHDFIELKNIGTTTITLTGASVQYASTTGTFNSYQALPSITLTPGQTYLIQEGGGSIGTPLPTPDFAPTTNTSTTTGTVYNNAFAMSATGGKVALASDFAQVTGPTATNVLDFVGWGAATTFEGSAAAPATSATLSISRVSGDTNNNATDFVAGTPTPTNSSGQVLGISDITSVKSNFIKNTLVKDEINFGSKADVKVYNMNGQVVRTASVSENKNLEVSDLAPGMYIVTGTVNGEAVSQKILKK